MTSTVPSFLITVTMCKPAVSSSLFRQPRLRVGTGRWLLAAGAGKARNPGDNGVPVALLRRGAARKSSATCHAVRHVAGTCCDPLGSVTRSDTVKAAAPRKPGSNQDLAAINRRCGRLGARAITRGHGPWTFGGARASGLFTFVLRGLFFRTQPAPETSLLPDDVGRLGVAAPVGARMKATPARNRRSMPGAGVEDVRGGLPRAG